MKNATLAIFDCDGVLIDSEVLYLEVERDFLKSKKVDVDHDWYVGAFMALAMPQWKQKLSDLLLEHTGAALTEDDYQFIKSESRRRVNENMRVVSGVEAMLDALHLPKCVASSTQMQFLPGKLELSGLDRYFPRGVYSGDMVERGKPAPDLFLLSAKDMGNHDPARCIVVEDSANGVKGAKAAGMFAVGFLGGGHVNAAHGERLKAAGADLIIEDHGALQRYFASLTA